MTDWTDVAARARGLAGRLLGRDRLIEASRVRDLSALADLLARCGYPDITEQAHVDPLMLEREVHRAAAARLDVLARWSGDRFPQLAPLYDDEDCRSLRAILRGVLAGAPVEQRLAGLVPTPSLPLGPLTELARRPDVAGVATLLVAWGHPYGAALLGEAMRPHPEAFRLELALVRRYGERALLAAAAAGEAMLRYVRLRLDLENAWTAIALAERIVAADPAELFLSGGTQLTPELYAECSHAADADAARVLLARRLRGSIVARVVAREVDEWTWEDAVLRALLVSGRREGLLDPLSIGVIVQYVLRARAELRDLARILWGIASNAPRAFVAESLVTP